MCSALACLEFKESEALRLARLAEEEPEEVNREAAEVVLADQLVEIHVEKLEDYASVLGILEVVPQPASGWAQRARA